MKQMEENVTKKDSCTGDKKRQSASSPKGSKLPPVCLRVDPLPRKKNGNGSLSLSSRSRSPSPPSSKGQSQATTGETFKTPVSGTHDKGQPNLINHKSLKYTNVYHIEHEVPSGPNPINNSRSKSSRP